MNSGSAGVSPATPEVRINQRQTTLSVRPKPAEAQIYGGSQAAQTTLFGLIKHPLAIVSSDGVVTREYVDNVPTLRTVAADGSDAREIAALGALAVDEVSWSPRGSEFLVIGGARGSVYGVVIGNDGTKLYEFDKGYAKWSPDGERIAVVWHRGAQRDEPEPGEVLLYTIAPDGSDRRDLVIASENYGRLPKVANPR